MTVIHGFNLHKKQDIKELKTHARLYLHAKTGAQLLSLSNDDENKVFGITFRTPPSDSTGVAHILEHSVLCGSRKYPLKEPFVELLKGSLQTFLNAFTYPDKTCYPVASQNHQDFYNLIDVYLDAVFYPRLTPHIFQQEGWHFELQELDQILTYKGVVFNEMKGAYSSPDNVLAEQSFQSLFPDTAYGFDSGGNPKHIPDLTFEQFVTFHQKHYHPSNARIYFYGDDDPEDRLRRLNDYLMDFESMEIDSKIRLQTLFKKPRRIVHPFMVGKEEDGKGKGMVTLNWLLTETPDPETNFSLRILEYILLGMPASPLRKALIDSGLGDDIAGEGLGTELCQLYFSTGLKGIEISTVEQIEALIMETLKNLVHRGIDPLTVEAAVNTIEFHLRENNSGRFPRGLSLLLRALTTWLYDRDPFALLAFEAPLERIKSMLRSKDTLFEEMIHRFFVKNPHRTTLILEPDPDLRRVEETVERDRLAKARSSRSADQLRDLVENTLELKRLQETPDPPEALASIPVLKLEDMDKKNKTIPITRMDREETPILFHDIFTSGIAYLDLGFNIHTLPDRYLSYVPLFGRALLEMGTETEDFVTLTQRISRKTGGIAPHPFTSTVRSGQQSAAWLFLRGKVMLSQTEALMKILRDVILSVRLDNQERFRQMVMEEKARVEQKLLPAGHQVVNLRLRAHFGEAHWAAEQMGGVSYLLFLRQLVEAIENKWSEVLATLREIHRILLNRNAMILNVTLDEKEWANFERQINQFLSEMPKGPVVETKWALQPPPLFEGLTIPSQVNYVGKGADLFKLGYQFDGSALVITRYLRNVWLWDRVRVQGGAYGAFSLFDRLSGVLTFVSYRDPNLLKTLEVFDLTADFLRDSDLSNEELTKSIIGAIGDLDAHMLPDARGYTSLLRHLVGDTEDARQQMRDQIFSTDRADFKAFASIMEVVKKNGLVKVLGSPSAVEAANSERSGWLNIRRVL
jgi:Zn-dependent M16 (insulinase) family peptidase